jgi:hypothetical protein
MYSFGTLYANATYDARYAHAGWHLPRREGAYTTGVFWYDAPCVKT